ncbi:MAG: OsmC family protein [Planctomycetes bacterium]|nr:OsmC family protein [Planctomycetota bacterium]
MVEQTILNGIAVGELSDCMSSLRQSPDIGKCTFKATCKWVSGAYCQTEISDFFASGEVIHRDKTHVLEGDEPVVLMGSDLGANATEALLHALGACLSASFIYHATDQGIDIESLEIDLQGNIDINGFLGLNEEIRNGFESIEVTFRVKSDAPREKIEELCNYAQKRSPVFDTVTNPVPVNVSLADE